MQAILSSKIKSLYVSLGPTWDVNHFIQYIHAVQAPQSLVT